MGSGHIIILHYLIRVRFGYNFEKLFNNSLPLDGEKMTKKGDDDNKYHQEHTLANAKHGTARNTPPLENLSSWLSFFLERLKGEIVGCLN